MGQEASLPQDGVDASLEEQARAPPSTVQPPTTTATTTTAPARPGRKLMSGKLFQRNTNEQPPDDNLLLQHQNQQQQQQQQQDEDYSNGSDNVVVGIMYEKTKTKIHKAGSGRGLLNSMRNLSMTVRQSAAAHNKKAAAVAAAANEGDWDKAWDEDESDEEEEEDELHEEQEHVKVAAVAPVSTPLVEPLPPQQQQYPSAATTGPLENTLEWDLAEPTAADEERPNMQMFLPMLRVLGKGSFGKVVLVQKRVGKERGQLFAMKILRKTHLVKRRQIERTRTERKVLSLVNHPFIMKLHFAFQSQDKLYLVLDYCPGGELFFHLSRFRRFPERVARFYAAELLLAIGHLHKRGIIYRDLKPENVLLDADGHVKLGDFGLAKANIVHPLEGAMSMCGTPEYMAPEVLAQQGHGFCVDYWGLGMIVYEMMTGLPPWYTTDRAKLFRRLKSAPLEIPSYFSGSAAACVTALLERDPRRRLGVTGIRTAMEHEFFRHISWRSLYSRRVEPPIRPCERWKGPTDEANAELTSPASTPDFAALEEMNAKDLDDATQNFDNQFTRMPVESEDTTPHEEDVAAELNSDTFRGFSFDGRDGPQGLVQPHSLD